MIKYLQRKIDSAQKFRCEQKAQRTHQVQFYNCWEQPYEQMYWNQFITSHCKLPIGKTIAIFSVFGERYVIDKVSADVKIFYSAENLKRVEAADYADHALGNKSIDLAMGFEVFEDPRYIRFPLWMDYVFPADSTEEDIRRICKQLRHPNIEGKDKFCCMIASNSADGLRKEMFEQISHIAKVDSAGRYLHNDDSLQKEFADNKTAYMQKYALNICPENTSAYGYTTEKVFEAISVGCIPIYWGADFADKTVINEDAIIRWNRIDGGKSALKQIEDLYANPKSMLDFLSQPRLLPTAEEYILDTFSTLEAKLNSIINKK